MDNDDFFNIIIGANLNCFGNFYFEKDPKNFDFE